MANSGNKLTTGRVIFILLLIGFLIEMIIRIMLAFSYVPETGGSSLDILYGILRMLTGRPLYTNPELPPYPVIRYMPLHYYIVAGVSQLFGAGRNIHDVSNVNRLIILLFNLCLFIPINRILYNMFEIRNRLTIWSAFFAVFLFIDASNFSGPGSFFLLVLLVSIYYLLCFLRLYSNKYGSELALSSIFGALAGFTNQFGFIIQVAIILFLWIKLKDQKATIRYALASGLAYLFLFMILIGSSFNYWGMNLFIGLFHFSLFSTLETSFINVIVEIIYLLAITGITLSLYFKFEFDIRYRFLRFLVLIILIFTVTGRVFFGLSANYFESGLFISIILFFVLIKNYPVVKPAARLIMICGSLIFIANLYHNNTWGLIKERSFYAKQYDDCAFVAGYVRQNVKNDEYIYTSFKEDNLMNLLIGEKALFPNKKISKSNYYESRSLHYDDFQKQLAEGKIKYLIGEGKVQPGNFLDQVFEGYEKESSIKGYDIYILKASK